MLLEEEIVRRESGQAVVRRRRIVDRGLKRDSSNVGDHERNLVGGVKSGSQRGEERNGRILGRVGGERGEEDVEGSWL